MEELTREFGPIYTLRLGFQTVIVVGRASVALELLDKRSAIYSSRPRTIMTSELVSRGLRMTFMPYGDLWRKQRKLLHQPTSPKAASTYELFPLRLLHSERNDLPPSHWALHLDPEVYPVPTQFNPERFIEDGKLIGTKYAERRHHAYGFGRRICPVIHIADRSFFIVFMRIMWACDITHSKDINGADIPVDVDAYSEGFSSHPLAFKCDIKSRGPWVYEVAAFLPLLLSVATLSRASEAALPLSSLVDAPDLYRDQLTRDTEVLYAAGYLGDRLEKRDTNAELYGAQTSPPAPVFRYGVGSTKVRGVSLGGWLVLESFITPSMFQEIDPRIVDEWTFGQYQTKAVAQAALTRHWSTWITEGDFATIAAAGLNHVRIPIGYWAFQVATGEPFVQGSLYFLDRAIAWAAKYNLKVMIDLHGAPGGQNGFDNSGRAGVLKWTTTYNQQRTRNVLQTISAEYAKLKYRNVVTAIQAVNEPAGYYAGVPAIVRDFYTSAYGVVRRHGTKNPNSILFTMSDAFQGFMSGPGYTDVAFDVHQYSTFDTTKIAFNHTQRIAYQCSLGAEIARSEKRIRTIVGEWTIAPTDCVGGGPLYSKIGNCTGKSGDSTQWSKAYKIWLRKFYEVQTQVYEQGSGWIMWTWKLESGDDWSYSAGLRGGWIPRDPTRKLYGNQCA